MKDMNTIADKINTISEFLAQRDITDLNSTELHKKYGIHQADLLILFGASILHGCDLAAKAFQNGIAKRMMIVGGEGHTTDTLRNIIHAKHPEYETKGKAESTIIAYYLQQKYGIVNCILEDCSTNCGNNVSNALEVVEKNGLNPKHILILQDSSMQRRMDAGFQKMWAHKNVEIINFASYRVKVVAEKNQLVFEDNAIEGLWSMDHFVNLQMGEIPRLTDTKDGYGPLGKNYIAHVDLPSPVLSAFEYLQNNYSSEVREANEKYK